MKTLRPYQSAAVNAFWHWVYNEKGFPFIAAAVNAGKSLIIAEIIRQAHTKWTQMKTIMLIDEQQLLVQNMEELRSQYADVDAGFYCAGLGQKRLQNAVTVASIQSIWKKAALLNKAPNLIIVDEGHGVSDKKDTQFRKFIEDCIALNPKCMVLGLSGSIARSDTGLVYGGDSLFAGLAYEIGVKFMIDEGYSVRPVMPRTKVTVDTSKVRQNKNDYIDKDLQAAFDIESITKECVTEIIEIGKAENRHQWLVYTTGIDHCENVYNEFVKQGITCGRTHSKSPDDVKEVLADYKAEKFQCLVVVGQAVKGFSHNGVELIAYMMKTKSTVKYEQTIGRGMRTNYAPDMPLDTRDQRLAAIAASRKPNFTLLDYGGIVAELGPVDAMNHKPKTKSRESKLDQEITEPKVKFCPKCENPCQPAHRLCYTCGYEFPLSVELQAKADRQSAVMSDDVEPEVLKVYDITFKKHRKRTPEDAPPATPVMRVTYHTMMGDINEWVCFEHKGFARKKAVKWHKEHMPFHPNFIPHTIDEAIELMTGLQGAKATSRYAKPHEITAKKKGKFWEIVGKEMPTKEELEELARIESMPEPEVDF